MTSCRLQYCLHLVEYTRLIESFITCCKQQARAKSQLNFWAYGEYLVCSVTEGNTKQSKSSSVFTRLANTASVRLSWRWIKARNGFWGFFCIKLWCRSEDDPWPFGYNMSSLYHLIRRKTTFSNLNFWVIAKKYFLWPSKPNQLICESTWMPNLEKFPADVPLILRSQKRERHMDILKPANWPHL